MGHITLTEEQARQVADHKGRVQVLDPTGRWVGVLSDRGWTAEELAEAKRRADAKRPGKTTGQMLDDLRGLKKA